MRGLETRFLLRPAGKKLWALLPCRTQEGWCWTAFPSLSSQQCDMATGVYLTFFISWWWQVEHSSTIHLFFSWFLRSKIVWCKDLPQVHHENEAAVKLTSTLWSLRDTYLLLHCWTVLYCFCHFFFMNSAQILREAFEDPINFHECGTAEPSYFRWQRFVPWTYIRNVVNCHHSVWRGVILIVLDWQIPPRILRQVILWHWLEKPAIDWLAAFWRKSIVCALTWIIQRVQR